jgi:hypothetical protein
LGYLQKHLTDLEVDPNQLTQLEQGMKFSGLCVLGFCLRPITASAKGLPPFAFTAFFMKNLGLNEISLGHF